MNELIELLRNFEKSRFYGSVELKYEAGRVVLIRKSETFKPCESGYGNNRSIGHESNRQS
jgi:hypothetical protein